MQPPELPTLKKGSDAEFLYHVLRDQRPHSHGEILERSFKARSCGMTIHSRAAQLRRLLAPYGWQLSNEFDPRKPRGEASVYQLQSPQETLAEKESRLSDGQIGLLALAELANAARMKTPIPSWVAQLSLEDTAA